MLIGEERDTTGRIWTAAPIGTLPSGLSTSSTTSILGVWLNKNERVEWHWCYTPQGNYVTGYSVLEYKNV